MPLKPYHTQIGKNSKVAIVYKIIQVFLTLYSIITPLKYHELEYIMENGAFATCFFKSIQNLT